MADTLNWGIIGAGGIAKAFAKGLSRSRTGRLVAVASRNLAKAEKFVAENAAADTAKSVKAYGSYEAVLADAAVQAVYVATPHPFHAEWAIKAARAKKHLLVEKPLGLNWGEAQAIIQAAKDHDVFLMEAFMYRCHPQTAKLVELIREGAIGTVRLIQATFGFHAGFNPEGRLFADALGGGGILDVGCYPVSLSRLIAGVAVGVGFADPVEVKGTGTLGQSGVDEWAAATLKFAGGIVAQVATSVGVNQENVARIYGSEGWILVPSPWVPAKEGGTVKIIVHKKGEKEPREVGVETTDHLYGIEADTVAAHLEKRQAPSPAMSWDDTLGNIKTLDLWRQGFGFAYQAEQPGKVPTVTREALAIGGTSGGMKYGEVKGLGKKVSRVIFGVDNHTWAPWVAAIWDDFIGQGGNAFDTAYIYGGGNCERALGAWVAGRGIREQVVLLGKGAHTPFCTPAAIGEQLTQSLERLRTDHLDLYCMHRDNPEVPVGEFVEALNEQFKAGRFKVFGGSNWSIERLEAANAYAKQKGLQPFTVVSNNFSLAQMNDPVWAGCIAASTPEWKKWLAKTRMTLLPWSSQARGFFTPRGDPADTSDKEMVRVWHSPDNFRRRERAIELAAKKGVDPIHIALAYVLHQPFPTFPLIGPRQISETRSSLAGLEVKLTEGEVKWLDLEG